MSAFTFPDLFPDNPKARFHYYVCLVFAISTAQTAKASAQVQDEIDYILHLDELHSNMVDFTEYGDHIDEVTTAFASMTFDQTSQFFRSMLDTPANTTIAALEWVQSKIAVIRHTQNIAVA